MAAFLWAMLAAVAGLGPFSSVASADVSGPDIVRFVSAQRVANGIPAPIAHDSGAVGRLCEARALWGHQRRIDAW